MGKQAGTVLDAAARRRRLEVEGFSCWTGRPCAGIDLTHSLTAVEQSVTAAGSSQQVASA